MENSITRRPVVNMGFPVVVGVVLTKLVAPLGSRGSTLQSGELPQ
jgi:hypothetical protein